MRSWVEWKPDREQCTALHQQIYEKMRDSLLAGDWDLGEKLPALRTLSKALNVSLTTIRTVYDRLTVEGFLQAIPKSGYRVQVLPRESFPSSLVEKRLAPSVDKKREIPPVRFALDQNQMSPGSFPWEEWQRAIRLALRTPEPYLGYGDAQGELSLRQVLTVYLRRVRGLNCVPEQIVIAAGAQPLLGFLLDHLAARRRQPKGEITTLRIPSRPIRHVFETRGLSLQVCEHLTTLPFASEGERGESKSSHGLYLQTDHLHGGMGWTAQDLQILQKWLATSPDRWVLEDDYHGELRFRQNPLPSLAVFAPEQTYYLSSFSKTLLPSVRLSYLVVPRDEVPTIQAALEPLHCTASVLEQSALAEYMRRGGWEKQLRRLRTRLAIRSETIESVLARALDRGYLLDYQSLDLSCTYVLCTAGGQRADLLAQFWRQQGLRWAELEETEQGEIARWKLHFFGLQEQLVRPALACVLSGLRTVSRAVPNH